VLSEPAVAAGESHTITFTLTCTSAQSGKSDKALSSMREATKVLPGLQPPSSGGGGAVDLLTLLALLGLRARRVVSREHRRRVGSQQSH
jgi:hypothetical protein